MHVRHSVRWLAGLAAGSLVLWLASSAAGQESKGRCKVFPLSGQPMEGEVVDLGTEYEITMTLTGRDGKPGGSIKRKIAKTQVARIEVLGEQAAAGGDAARGGSFRAPITDAMIQEILGSDNIEVSSLDSEDAAQQDVMGALDLDQSSVNDMLRIAGARAKTRETDHFVFVYTSDLDKASEQAANLERVYRWCVKFNEMMGIRSERPRSKLEIYFFGSQKEYDAYLALHGTMIQGTAGVYMRDTNRSAFYDLMKSDNVLQLLEALKNAPPDEARRIRNRITRLQEDYNLRVVQHEAAHHIHFNIGTFPRLADIPRWVVEGLAQMFEIPLYDSGAALGTTNYLRLYQFRQIFGARGERLPDMKVVILNDGWWGANFGGGAYPMGWALNHYLLKRHREQYRQWMQHVADLEEHEDWNITDKQARFEELFGEINEDWTKKFADYIASIELKREGFD